MKTGIREFVAALAIVVAALVVQAAEPATKNVDQTWTLATEDTELTLAVTGHAISIVSLRNPMQKWNWVTAPSLVPPPDIQAGKGGPVAAWEYWDAAEDKTNGHQLSLRFRRANPAMELKSVWRALPGPGPVENEVFIENKSGDPVVFPPTLAAAKVNLTADGAVTLHRARKTQVGIGEVLQDTIGALRAFQDRLLHHSLSSTGR